MNRMEFPGGWYCDATTSGAYVVAPYDAPLLIRTGLGTIPTVDNKRWLFAVIADDGVQIAGVGHEGSVKDRALRWDGQRWHDHGLAFGPQPLIFDRQNRLHVVTGPPAHGYRSVNDAGQLVTASATYADANRRIWEYTQLGDVTIGQGGQGPHGDDPVIALVNGQRYLVQSGRCRFVKVRRQGEQLALAWVQEDQQQAVLLWLTVTELMHFPLATTTAPQPKPQPKPEPVPEQPMPDHVPNLKPVVERVRAKYPTPLGARHAEFLMELAPALSAESRLRIGLLKKTGGTVIKLPDKTTVSQDVVAVHQQTELWTYDVLGSGETKATPTWNRTKPTGVEKDLSRFYAVSATPSPKPEPKPDQPHEPAPALCTCASQIAELKQRLDEAESELVALHTRLRTLEDNPLTLENVIAALPERIKGSTSRDWGHAHEIDLKVTR